MIITRQDFLDYFKSNHRDDTETYLLAGGIDHMLSSVITQCQASSLPIVFSMSRQALGATLKRKVPVSVIGIFNYDGAEVRKDSFFLQYKHTLWYYTAT